MSHAIRPLAELPWGIYLRISRTDDRRGVERQLDDCLARLEIMGEDPESVVLFDENNTSATKGLEYRPEYLRMVEEIKRRRLGGVMVFLQDRGWRDTDELSAFLKLGARFGTSSTGEANLDDPDTIANLKTNTVNAEREIKIAGRRIARASRQRAEAGRAHGRAPFGWRREVVLARGRVVDSWDVLDEAEAGLLQHCAAELLEGKSLRSVTLEANEGDVLPRAYEFGRGRYAGRTARQQWSGQQIKTLLLRPSNAGLRQHKGEILEGVITEAPPIFDMQTFDRLRLLFADPSRRSNERGGAPRWLMSGIAVCGNCGDVGRINVHTGGNRKNARPVYTCVGQPGARGCLQRHFVEDVDRYIGELVEGRLADKALAEAAPEAQQEIDGLQRRIDALRAEQATYGELKAARKITLPQLLAMNEDVDGECSELEGRISDLRPATLGSIRLPDGWAGADLATKRAVVRVVFERVELGPSDVTGKLRRYESLSEEVRHSFRGVRK